MINVQHKKISGIIIIAIISVSFLLYAFSTGISGRTLKNGTGCNCHSESPSNDVTVVISGPDTLAPGQASNYVVTITGGDLIRGGTNIASSEGSLAPVSSDLQIMSGELTHTQPKAPSGSSVTFEFTYTAPLTSGTQTLYANGNSVNFNGTNTGDKWNFAVNKTVTVSSITGVDENYTSLQYDLEQNYPNPFNPSTRINFTLAKAGNAEISVFNSIGEKVQELHSGYLESGTHSVNFNAVGLSTGIYYYKLITNDFVSVRKMMLVK